MNKTATEIMNSIQEEYNLDSSADLFEFVFNLVKEVEFYKDQRDKLYRRSISAEQIIENTRLVLGILDKKEISILEAIQELKRRAV